MLVQRIGFGGLSGLSGRLTHSAEFTSQEMLGETLFGSACRRYPNIIAPMGAVQGIYPFSNEVALCGKPREFGRTAIMCS
jgi:hypothetical protein